MLLCCERVRCVAPPADPEGDAELVLGQAPSLLLDTCALPRTSPQRNGKDPVAGLVAAAAARKRAGHSALAQKLLKECAIDQASIRGLV